VEHLRGCPRGRCVAHYGEQLDARLPGIPARQGRRLRAGVAAAGGASVSPRFLSQDERIEIADLRHAGLSLRRIAAQPGRAPSRISRELRRNATASRDYRPFEAHRRATARRARHHRCRIDVNLELRQLIGELLTQRWSPQQISRHLRGHQLGR
jgi:IS30 family transposase